MFGYLERDQPGAFGDGSLRTLQRRVKKWWAPERPVRKIFFAQLYRPEELSESDFTYMTTLGVTFAGCRFDHLIRHFVLLYSGSDTGTSSFSESLESLFEGLHDALLELADVPLARRTDRLSATVHKALRQQQPPARYNALLRHYGRPRRPMARGYTRTAI